MTAARKALVTGATSGIGGAVCERLLSVGHSVVGVGRDFTKVDFSKIASADSTFHREVLDLADLDQLEAPLRRLAERHADVDILVLAAGQGRFGHLEELSYAQIRALIDLDVTSQAWLARAFLPVLKRRRRGDVVFLGSEAGLQGRRQGSIYCACKFALRGLAQALREECAKSGVRVTIVNPGMVATPFFDNLDFAPGAAPENALRAEEVAAAIEFLLAQRAGVVVDEINLSPLKRVVEKKSTARGR